MGAVVRLRGDSNWRKIVMVEGVKGTVKHGSLKSEFSADGFRDRKCRGS